MSEKDIDDNVEHNEFVIKDLELKGDVSEFEIDTTLIKYGYFQNHIKKEPIIHLCKEVVDGKEYSWDLLVDMDVGLPRIHEKKTLRAIEILINEYLQKTGVVPSYINVNLKKLILLVEGRDDVDYGKEQYRMMRKSLDILYKTRLRKTHDGKEEYFRVIKTLVPADKSVASKPMNDMSRNYIIVLADELLSSLVEKKVSHDEEFYRKVSKNSIALGIYEKIQFELKEGETTYECDLDEFLANLKIKSRDFKSEKLKRLDDGLNLLVQIGYIKTRLVRSDNTILIILN